jgi:hypothetical protein
MSEYDGADMGIVVFLCFMVACVAVILSSLMAYDAGRGGAIDQLCKDAGFSGGFYRANVGNGVICTQPVKPSQFKLEPQP